MAKFRKKPVVIEALRFWNGDGPSAINECLKFLGDEDMGYWSEDNGCIYIITLEGEMKCSDGDWIIRGVAGEFYPCKPDIFEQTYEPVD